MNVMAFCCMLFSVSISVFLMGFLYLCFLEVVQECEKNKVKIEYIKKHGIDTTVARL